MARFALALLLIAGVANSAAADDLFAVGAKWKGTEAGDARNINSKSVAVSLKITKRDNNLFQGEYWLLHGGSRSGLKVEGQTGNNGVIVIHPLGVLEGTFKESVFKEKWEGKVNGKSIHLDRQKVDVKRRIAAIFIDLTFEEQPDEKK